MKGWPEAKFLDAFSKAVSASAPETMEMMLRVLTKEAKKRLEEHAKETGHDPLNGQNRINTEMQCEVTGVYLHFDRETVRVAMAPDHHVDMNGCIKYISEIMPECTLIQTFQYYEGGKAVEDTWYRKVDGRWTAHAQNQATRH